MKEKIDNLIMMFELIDYEIELEHIKDLNQNEIYCIESYIHHKYGLFSRQSNNFEAIVSKTNLDIHYKTNIMDLLS